MQMFVYVLGKICDSMEASVCLYSWSFDFLGLEEGKCMKIYLLFSAMLERDTRVFLSFHHLLFFFYDYMMLHNQIY